MPYASLLDGAEGVGDGFRGGSCGSPCDPLEGSWGGPLDGAATLGDLARGGSAGEGC